MFSQHCSGTAESVDSTRCALPPRRPRSGLLRGECRTIASRDGIAGLYSGLSAGILRQLTYGGPRMAIYPMLVDKAKRDDEKARKTPHTNTTNLMTAAYPLTAFCFDYS